MKAARALTVLFCVCFLLLSGSGFVVAQQQQKTETEPKDPPSKTEAESEETDKDKEEEEEKKPRPFQESVKVTAQHVETDLMKTPIAISVFDQDELDREGVQNIRDMAQMVPNMDIATINGQSAPVISLRGIRSTNETELGDSAVGVHLDGVYSPRMQGILGLMFDNERVEVLRGPQGTLYGRNSTVGSINIITAKPKLNKWESTAVVRAGNWNSEEVAAMANMPINDKFAFRVAARTYRRDSYLKGYWDANQYDQRRIADKVQFADVISDASLDPVSGETFCTDPRCYTRTQKVNWWADHANAGQGYPIRELIPADPADFYMNADENAFRLSALWQPKRNVSVDLMWQRYLTESAGGVDLVNCEKLRGRPNYESVFEQDEFGNFVRDDNGDLIQIGFVQVGTNDCSDMFPEDDTYQAVVNTPGRFFLEIDYLRSRVTWDIKDDLRFVYLTGRESQDRESAQDMEQSLNAWDQAFFFLPGTGSGSWSHEVQIQSYGNKPFNWIAGANYFRERTSTLGYFDNAIDEKSLFDQPNRSTGAGALFAQGTYSYSPKWHLTLGYRFSDETKEDRNGRTYTCRVDNGCEDAIAATLGLDPGEVTEFITPPGPSRVRGWERQALNQLPVNYFNDPANYPTFQANDNRGSWSNNDFRVGLDYQKDDDTLLYSYLATGFKAGGIGDVFDQVNPRTNEAIRIETSYGPEQVTTLELGFKKSMAGNKLKLKGAYFYSDYEDMQYASVGAIGFNERLEFLRDEFGNLIPDGMGFFEFGWVPVPIVAYFTQNVPGAQIQGYEFEYDWAAWPGGRIKGYASWLDTTIRDDWNTIWSYDPRSYFPDITFDQSINPETEILQVNLKGNELAVSPPFKFHVTVDHAFMMPGQRTTVVPWVTAHWEADSYLTIWNVDKHTDDLDFAIFDEDIRYTDDKREAWSMVHAGVRIYHGNWTIEFYGYNLTNEVIQWWGGAAEQVAKGSFSTPRNYGFHVGTRF